MPPAAWRTPKLSKENADRRVSRSRKPRQCCA
jgi:hypothetical protein